MKTIVVTNTKGGTGKTSTVLNLSTELGLLGLKVLLIDVDPQASLSKAILKDKLGKSRGIEQLLEFSAKYLDVNNYIKPTEINNVSIIPCHSELAETAVKLLMNASFFALKDVLRKINDFDYIILDTQPSKNILMLNALSASNYALIPTNPGIYPLLDIQGLNETIKNTALNSNPDLQLLGIVITMSTKGTIYRQLEQDLRETFGDKVFTTVISRLVKNEESAFIGKGVSLVNPNCKLSLQYQDLTAEILHRLKNK